MRDAHLSLNDVGLVVNIAQRVDGGTMVVSTQVTGLSEPRTPEKLRIRWDYAPIG